MSCSSPLTAYRCSDGSLVWFEGAGSDVVETLFLPCGKCAMCRASRAAQLATRMGHEAAMHEQTCVVTLTYADEFLEPAGTTGSVHRRHVDLFVKQVRNDAVRRGAPKVRVCGVSEYSPGPLRPHYHLQLFGYWPDDAVPWNTSRAGNRQYSSETVSRLWGRGHVTFQFWTPGAADYIARHDSWKLTGRADAHSGPMFGPGGVLLGRREPEFLVTPRRPGLGAGFFDRYGEQMLALDFCIVGGRKAPLPGYYLRRGERSNPDRVSQLKAEHSLAALKAAPDATRARLAVREQCAMARVAMKRRDGVDRG